MEEEILNGPASPLLSVLLLSWLICHRYIYIPQMRNIESSWGRKKRDDTHRILPCVYVHCYCANMSHHFPIKRRWCLRVQSILMQRGPLVRNVMVFPVSDQEKGTATTLHDVPHLPHCASQPPRCSWWHSAPWHWRSCCQGGCVRGGGGGWVGCQTSAWVLHGFALPFVSHVVWSRRV